jgi:uncharacterized protein (TIGR02271 family)
VADEHTGKTMKRKEDKQDRQTQRTVPVIEEQVEIHTERVETGSVRVHKSVHTTEQTIDEPMTFVEVEVQRKAMDTFVDTATPVRQQGDTTIISIYEEVPVVEKRLKLKEEIHITRRRRTESDPRRIELRREEAVIDRRDETGSPQP